MISQMFSAHPILCIEVSLILGFGAIASLFFIINIIGTVIYLKVLSFFFKKDITDILKDKISK